MSYDYSAIMADKAEGTIIGRMYLAANPSVTLPTRFAYRAFAQEIELQFREVARDIRVSFVDDDPYSDASEMFADVRKGRLAVYKTTPKQRHPLLSNQQNDRFRAVHDYFGHFHTGRDFSRHGEEAAWVLHSQMFGEQARRAMTTETRGQNSAFTWVMGGEEFPPQKAVLLPRWVSEIPTRYEV